jgi:hypothetical protein
MLNDTSRLTAIARVAKTVRFNACNFLGTLLILRHRLYEGPYRLIQNRSRTSLVALKSDAAAERSKGQLSARFLGLFDFRLLQLLQQNLPIAEIADAGALRKSAHRATVG